MKKNIYSLITIVAVGLVAGCTNSDSGNTASVEKHKLPKMTFHRPEGLQNAIDRMQSIHGALIGTGELPQPTSYEVVEVIHGEGAAAHSHYYLASEYKEGMDHHDDHAEMKESIERHQVVVDARTELNDIAGWLPEIAVLTNLDEPDWNALKDTSKSIQSLFKGISDDSSESEFREAWKTKSAEMETHMNKLQEIAKKASEE